LGTTENVQYAARWERSSNATGVTRSVTAAYAVILLSIFVRIQLNLIGQHTYLDSVGGLDQQQQPDGSKRPESALRTLAFAIEQQYLALSWYFLNHGLPALRAIVEDAVKTVLSKCVFYVGL
jgi:hypothetical protein